MSPGTGGVRVALLAFGITFAVMIANGRAIGSGDTNAVERTAGALATRGGVVLEGDDTGDPFTRAVPGGRVSIYPLAPALLAAPFFFIFGRFFDLDPFALPIAGKLWAALLSSGAIGILAGSFARRAPPGRALVSALLLGLGTSMYSTAQALWQHPSVLLFMAIALRALEGIEALEGHRRLRPAMIAAFCLSLAAASRPAVIPMCAVLFVFLLSRTLSDAPRLLLAAAVPALLVSAYNLHFFGAPWRFGQAVGGRFLSAFPESLAGLLMSPGRGLLVFTPIVLVALVGLLSHIKRSMLARALAAAALTHLLFMSTWNEWHGGESFGPRLLTDLLPALFFFLPEGLVACGSAGVALGLVSVMVQLLGGWTYDYRWERLHQRGQDFNAALWTWRDSPIAFALREGVLLQGRPVLDARRVRLRVRRTTPFGPEGSLIENTPQGLRVSGAALVRDIRLERGGRTSEGGILLSHPADALAFRVIPGGPRELRLTGSLEGTLRIEFEGGTVQTLTTGAFDLSRPIKPGPETDVFVRAESGTLHLARASLK